MTYEEWKSIKSITGADNERVIRNFELSNPSLAASYKRRKEKELEDMRNIMSNPNREQRWKQIANSAYAHDPTFATRRRREEM